MLATDAPTVADWMQGWGSLAGVFTSLVAIIFTGLLLRHEIRARRRDEQDSSSAQAKLVWVTAVQGAVTEGSSRTTANEMKLTFRVTNYSEQPIFNLFVQPIPQHDHVSFLREGEGRIYDNNFRAETLEPGAGFEGRWFVALGEPFTFGMFGVRVSFTDRAGLRWSTASPPFKRLEPYQTPDYGIVGAYMRMAIAWRPIRSVRMWYAFRRRKANVRLMTRQDLWPSD